MSVIPEDIPSKGLIGPVLAAAGVLLLWASLASAEKWSRRYIESLPDSAFASIESTPDGKKVRHLPHHNLAGEVDIPHLKSALSRLHQVEWVDPSHLAEAKAHLEEHYQAYKQKRAKAYKMKEPININTAPLEELLGLPHIGKRRARAIIAYRKTHGKFETASELLRVPGIGPKIFKDIEDLVTTE